MTASSLSVFKTAQDDLANAMLFDIRRMIEKVPGHPW